MDQKIGPDQHIPPDQQAISDQKATLDQQAAPEQQEQQAASVQEPTSDQFPMHPDQISPEGNEAYLFEHQRRLRYSYPSCDLSEVSYHTEHTDLAGSRHSSVNTEPLTLDAEQIHDAKDQAVDVIQKVGSEKPFNIFTKDLSPKSGGPLPPEESEVDQMSPLADKAQLSRTKLLGAASNSADEKTSPQVPAPSLEDDVKLKAK